ncbi:MAG: hypothetical protein DDT35_01497 [Firmicutes bacterium]|nr:hypothetical protein [Bacillota bacterium]
MTLVPKERPANSGVVVTKSRAPFCSSHNMSLSVTVLVTTTLSCKPSGK